VRKYIPQTIINLYHALVTWLAMARYGFPTKKMITIGVTGTDGKTSTVNYISQVLEAAGHRTGFSSTANFKVASQFKINPMKMTMPGRWHLAKLLSRMQKAGTEYAIVETTSEGLRQNRHLGIAYDLAVFTNLSREHIESHGSLANYQRAKEKLFATLSHSARKSDVKKIIVANLDDPRAKYFLAYDADQKWGFSLEADTSGLVKHLVRPTNYVCSPAGISFELGSPLNNESVTIKSKILGIFNLRNMLAAATVALTQGVSLAAIKKGLEAIEPVPGRMEPIDEGQAFTVIVDYAHAPASLELAYKTMREQITGEQRLIAVLGAAGGGRDKAKRPVLGALAAKYADFALVTNEDPYDEDPRKIIDQVAEGLIEAGKKDNIDFFRILHRKDAIERALTMARAGDVIIITGKGCEPVIMSKGGQRLAQKEVGAGMFGPEPQRLAKDVGGLLRAGRLLGAREQ